MGPVGDFLDSKVVLFVQLFGTCRNFEKSLLALHVS